MNEILVYFITVSIGTTFAVFNIITIGIIAFDKKLRNRIANYPILSFLIGSAGQGLLAAPIYIFKKIEHKEHLQGWVCDAYRVPYFFCGHIMKLSLLLVSIDRMMAVRFPYKYQKLTKKKISMILVFLWLCTIAVDTIPFMSGHQDGTCRYIPTRTWGLSVIIIYNIIPFCLITINYSLIWVTAARFSFSDKARNDSMKKSFRDEIGQNGANAPANISNFRHALEMKATKTSLTLLAIYVICWGPLGVFYMIDHFCFNCLSHRTDLDVTRAAIKILCFTSSLLAPIVYCWWNRDYRRAAARMLWKCGFNKKDRGTINEETEMFVS